MLKLWKLFNKLPKENVIPVSFKIRLEGHLKLMLYQQDYFLLPSNQQFEETEVEEYVYGFA